MGRSHSGQGRIAGQFESGLELQVGGKWKRLHVSVREVVVLIGLEIPLEPRCWGLSVPDAWSIGSLAVRGHQHLH